MPRTKKKTVSTDSIENKTYSFNLIDCPWIWVLKTDGKTGLVSLHDLFDQADSIYSLANENIYVNASIQLILFSIRDVAYSRDSKTRNMTNKRFVYYKDVIQNYLSSVHDRFDIYDSEHPFMQVSYDCGKLRNTLNDTCCLDPFNSSSNKTSQWSVKSEYDDAWIARHLIVYRMWNLSIPAAGGKKNGVKDIRYGFLHGGFSLVFIHGETLADTLRLNFNSNNLKKTMHPIWETSIEEEESFITDRKTTVTTYNKNEATDCEYYDAVKNLDVADSARILTYSNLYISIDPATKKFKQGYHLPIKLFKAKYDDKKKIQYDWSDLKEILNIYTGPTSDKPSYSIQKNIIDEESFPNAKNIVLVRPPKTNKQRSKLEDFYRKPVNLIGNGLLKAEVEGVSEKTKNNIFKTFLGALEDIEKKFKNFKKVSSNWNKDDTRIERNRKIFNSMISDNASYAENLLLDFVINFLSVDDLGSDILENESFLIKKQVYGQFLKSYKQFVKSYCPDLYFELDRRSEEEDNDNIKKLGVSTMSKLDRMKEIAMNFKSCVDKDGKDLVKLRDMRNGEYTPGLNLDSFNTVGVKNVGNRKEAIKNVGNRKEAMKIQGVRLALNLWANHQHLLADGEDAHLRVKEEYIKETVNHEYTFGYLLYRLSKFYTKDDWDVKCNKYEKASRNINNLVQFMRLTIKEAVSRGIKVQLDYGRLAYLFSRILENKANTSEFLEDVMTGFYISKNKDCKMIPR